MTDYTEKAREIGWRWFGVGHHDAAALASEVKEALREAQMEERERCAKIAASFPYVGDPMLIGPAIAHAIFSEAEAGRDV